MVFYNYKYKNTIYVVKMMYKTVYNYIIISLMILYFNSYKLVI